MCIQDILINYFVSKIFSYLWQKDFICCSSVILMELNVIFKIHRHYISDHLKQSLQTSVMVHLESNNRSRLHKSSFGLWKPTYVSGHPSLHSAPRKTKIIDQHLSSLFVRILCSSAHRLVNFDKEE